VSSKPQPRVPVDLELRVWGMSADGRVFSQHARARNVSAEGALLSDIEPDLKVGDIIGVQSGNKKARCKVVWTADTRSAQRTQAGVRLLDGQDCPWTASLEETPAAIPQNRRKWERHKIIFVISIHDGYSPMPMRVSATDISARGCYVETISPYPIGTSLMVDLSFAAGTITTRSFVRACYPGVGMGIEFMGLTPEQEQRFQQFLRAIDPWACSIELQSPKPGNA
jgi:hypothetical protein